MLLVCVLLAGCDKSVGSSDATAMDDPLSPPREVVDHLWLSRRTTTQSLPSYARPLPQAMVGLEHAWQHDAGSEAVVPRKQTADFFPQVSESLDYDEAEFKLVGVVRLMCTIDLSTISGTGFAYTDFLNEVRVDYACQRLQ
jgi:hypothetical protein